MPFVYRLEKVLVYRINKKDEQVEVVKKAEEEVRRIEGEIQKNQNLVLSIRQNMRTAPHTMMESYDNYIKHLYEVIEKLEQEKQEAIKVLMEEKEKLVELEKNVKILEKHKERQHEEYLEEEKKAEMKVLDEIASQKYFAKTQIQKEETELEELMELQNLEGINLDGY